MKWPEVFDKGTVRFQSQDAEGDNGIVIDDFYSGKSSDSDRFCSAVGFVKQVGAVSTAGVTSSGAHHPRSVFLQSETKALAEKQAQLYKKRHIGRRP